MTPLVFVGSVVAADVLVFAGAALALFAVTAAQAGDAVPHDDEVRIFATTMAIARTVRDNCPGVAADDRLLEVLRQRLHVVDADRPAFAPVAHAAADALKQALQGAPSRQAWCDLPPVRVRGDADAWDAARPVVFAIPIAERRPSCG